jgi:hypothetical protein
MATRHGDGQWHQAGVAGDSRWRGDGFWSCRQQFWEDGGGTWELAGLCWAAGGGWWDLRGDGRWEIGSALQADYDRL